MKFIQATLAHLDALAYMVDDFRQCYEQKPDFEACKTFIEERITKEECFFLILFTEVDAVEYPAGFVSIYPSFNSVSLKKILYLSDLYVAPEFRKNGFAKELINYAKQYAKDKIGGQLVIESRISNSSAQRLYDSVGFTKEGEHLYYYLEE